MEIDSDLRLNDEKQESKEAALKKAIESLEDLLRINPLNKEASDYKEGKVILKSDTNITAPVLGILASQGLKEVKVYKNPSIAIISTGTELVEELPSHWEHLFTDK